MTAPRCCPPHAATSGPSNPSPRASHTHQPPLAPPRVPGARGRDRGQARSVGEADTVAAAVRTAGVTAAGAGRATVMTAGGTPALPRCSHAHTLRAELTSTFTTAARLAQAARSLSAA